MTETWVHTAEELDLSSILFSVFSIFFVILFTDAVIGEW